MVQISNVTIRDSDHFHGGIKRPIMEETEISPGAREMAEASRHRLFNYHAVPTNGAALATFRYYVIHLWRRSLRWRGPKAVMTWERMGKLANDWLPRPRTL